MMSSWIQVPWDKVKCKSWNIIFKDICRCSGFWPSDTFSLHKLRMVQEKKIKDGRLLIQGVSLLLTLFSSAYLPRESAFLAIRLQYWGLFHWIDWRMDRVKCSWQLQGRFMPANLWCQLTYGTSDHLSIAKFFLPFLYAWVFSWWICLGDFWRQLVVVVVCA